MQECCMEDGAGGGEGKTKSCAQFFVSDTGQTRRTVHKAEPTYSLIRGP